jgi:hypothetical protein
MKRISSLFLLSITMGGTLFAKQIDQQTAATVAQNFIASKVSGINSGSLKLVSTQAVQTAAGTGINAYYVFDVNNKGGFVVVSADDIVKPILAYSNTNEFQTGNNVSPETAYWMNLYQKQIAFAVDHNIEATKEAIADWSFYTEGNGGTANKPTNTVAPLTQTTWDQGTYYNIYTPGTGNTKTPVGCVATAMAQIMKYWDQPTTGTGSYSYNHQVYGQQSANFGTTDYHFGIMPNKLTSSSSQTAKNAVSLLGYHCAVAVKMDFAPEGSGSQVLAWSNNAKCAENAFKNYFGYKTTITGLYREDYNDADWDALLKTELDNERPILYAGWGNVGGHAFVFDGYDENDMFHINWGWSGQSNGYFTVNNLSPSVLGIGAGAGNFNDNQQALTKIEPIQARPTLEMAMNSALTISAPTFLRGSAFSVTGNVANIGTFDFGGSLGAGVYKASDGTFMAYIKYVANQFMYFGNDSTMTFSTTGINALVAGDYFAKMIYKPETASDWIALPDGPGFTNKVTFTVTENATGIENLELEKSFTVYPNPANSKLTVSLKNFTGKVSNMQMININGQVIGAIESTNAAAVNIPVNQLSNGIYNLRITTDQGTVNKKIVVQH